MKPVRDLRIYAPNSLRPGDIVMHSKQYNELCQCELLRVRRQGDKKQITWNGVPIHINDRMPEAGWFIVPGYEWAVR